MFCPGKSQKFALLLSKGGRFQRQSLWSLTAVSETLELNLFNSYRQAHFRRFGTLFSCKRVPKTDCKHKLSLKNYPVDDF